jgi:hypothetical protein
VGEVRGGGGGRVDLSPDSSRCNASHVRP